MDSALEEALAGDQACHPTLVDDPYGVEVHGKMEVEERSGGDQKEVGEGSPAMGEAQVCRDDPCGVVVGVAACLASEQVGEEGRVGSYVVVAWVLVLRLLVWPG